MARHIETYRGIKLWKEINRSGLIVYGTTFDEIMIKRNNLDELKRTVDSYMGIPSETFNVRIDIKDLINAARALGEFRVMAAGSMYATIETNEAQRKQLTRALVTWARD